MFLAQETVKLFENYSSLLDYGLKFQAVHIMFFFFSLLFNNFNRWTIRNETENNKVKNDSHSSSSFNIFYNYRYKNTMFLSYFHTGQQFLLLQFA